MKPIDFKAILKKALPHICAIIIMYLLTVIYFSPAIIGNKDIPQGDVSSVQGWGHDLRQYHQETGDYAYWSNGMFSGMPANYTYMPPTVNIFKQIGNILKLGLPGNHAAIVFLYLIGFYIFLVSMGCKAWLALAGAIGYAFGAYNFVILEAGHLAKGLVMATMAPIIGGVILTYRKKYLWGILITLIFTGLNVAWCHQQISYYLIIILAVLAITYFIYAIKEHTLKSFFISSAILVVVALLAVLPATGKLIPDADYAKETMRGGAVLKNNAAGEKENAGLNIDYAYQWSYGKAETMTLLIPNFYGASSHYNLGNDSECYQTLRSTGQGKQFCRYAPTYWGAQPFTSGPVYAGAIICFLFLFGLFVVKSPEKWWILVATIISVILSWGKNFAVVNDFLFYHLPLYSKFRTPSMALVIAGVTMAALAALAIKTIADHRNDKDFDKLKKKYLKYLYISAGITGGICLIFALFGGSLCNFSAAGDANYPEWLTESLRNDRKMLLTKDAWRSFAFILVAFIITWCYLKYKFKATYLYLALAAFTLFDLWGVDRRFINEDSFVAKKKANAILPTEADNLILQDKDPDYRVLNLTTNTFNESQTSYFHKSIGGYSPAKLRRYQDIIDYHLSSKINMNVLNMLNTRYFIVPGQDQYKTPMVQKNPEAMGNAWFVDSIRWVNSPDEEIVAITDFNPSKVAYIDKMWQDKLPNSTAIETITDSSAFIKLTNYANPGNLIYSSSNSKAQLAVFSEVFYKTWHCYIDDKEVPLIRVNYILRGVQIPAGIHKIEFKCIDDVYLKSAKLSIIGSIIVGITLLGLIVALIWQGFRKKKNAPIPVSK